MPQAGQAFFSEKVSIAPSTMSTWSETVCEPQGGFDRVGQPGREPFVTAQAIGAHQAVHHYLDVMLFRLGQFDALGQLHGYSIDSSPGVSVGARLVEHLFVGAFSPSDDRRQHLEAGGGWKLGDLINDLLG